MVSSGLFGLLWEDILFKHVLCYLSLKELFILRGVSRDGKRLIDSYLEYLQELNLSYYHHSFTPEAFKVLSGRCRRLRKVILSNCDFLTDDLVSPLFAANPHITYLVLNDCRSLSSACLQNVILSCKNLKCLKLKNCYWLTVGCLEAITLHQESLEEVDITSCTGVFSKHAMNCFIKKFRNLRKVCLANNACVTNSTLFGIAKSCRHLEHINLQACCFVSDEGLRVLVDYCTELKSILVMGCPRVSLRYLEVLRTKVFVDKPMIGGARAQDRCLSCQRNPQHQHH